MRKVFLAVVVMLLGLLLVSCSSADNETSNNGGNEKSSSSGPLIEPANAIDERLEIENMMEEQKELLKLGFITDDNLINNIQISRRVTFYDDDYDFSEDDRVDHSSFYTTEGSNPTIQFSGTPFLCDEGLDEWTDDLVERQSFNYDDKEGFYGHIEYESSEIVVKHKDKCYSAHVSTDEGYTDDDKRLLELISNTFKTEAEGAYDPFYSRFTMDLDKIKFPSMNQDRVTLAGTSISYWEDRFDGNHSKIGGAYYIDEDSMVFYEITDSDKIYDDKEKSELKTDQGTTVTVYVDDTFENHLKYRWTDGTYNYLIEVDEEETSLSDKDILAVIDSAMEDDRSFDNLDFFKGVQDAPDLGEDELELQEYFNKND